MRVLRKSIVLWIITTAVLFAQNQDVPFDKPSLPTTGFPKFQIFVGGSYMRVHASGAEAPQVVGLSIPDFALEQHNLNFGLYGWHFALTENANRWLGIDVDFSGFYSSPKPPFLCSAATLTDAATCPTAFPDLAPVTTKLHAFLFGPRFSFRRYGRFVPFAHILLGPAHISGQVDHTAIFLPESTVLPQGFSRSTTAFAAAPGIGADLVLSPKVAVRLLEIDYVMTRFYGQRQDNGRASAGLVFQFGNK